MVDKKHKSGKKSGIAKGTRRAAPRKTPGKAAADAKGSARTAAKKVTRGARRTVRKARKRRARNWSGGARVAGLTVRWFLIFMVWIGVAVSAIVAWYAYDLPDIDNLKVPERRASLTLTDAGGRSIAVYGDLYAGSLQLKNMPPHLKQAILATEDRRFFEHGGFDVFALARALAVNLYAGRIRQGGSTLTQQLAKNIFLKPDRTVRRKVQELLLTFWLEANFTKEQIFTLYVNRVYLGSGAYGFEAASRRYFGKSARRVTLLQAAVLAGLLKAPSRYSPLRDPQAARKRAGTVLKAMVDAGFIDGAARKRALRQKLNVVAIAGVGRHFSDWVLERVAGFVSRDGQDLIVRTTLDLRLQRLAEARLRATIAKNGKAENVRQGALVALSHDGAVRAMVGGRDYSASQFNRASQALRQPGSAFKLFVYLAALESGLAPDDIFADRPLRIGKWQPRNHEKTYRGDVDMREAMAHSINTVAVSISEKVGRRKVIEAARRLGVTSPIRAHPSLALGASEVTLLELTGAYCAIANNGIAAWPYGIAEIRRSDGTVLYRRKRGEGSRVVSRSVARDMRELLRGVVADGTGKAANPGWTAAGKTGTSQGFRDAWFVGYAGDLVTGVWMGNDNGARMKGVTGGQLPARLWRDFMTAALGGS